MRDRINDAYFGKMGDKFGEHTRARVDMICKYVTGTQIIDLGCSEGITDIILSREGKTITAVDMDAESIAIAKDYLSKEPQEVQNRVHFTAGDIFGLEIQDRFDCVIATEIIEHLYDMRILELASSLLKDNGRIILSAPFGLNPFPGHVRTFYIHDLCEQVSKYFNIIEVNVLNAQHTFIIAEKSVQEAGLDKHDLFALMEKSILTKELNYNNEIESQRTRILELSDTLENVQAELANTKNELAKTENELKKAIADKKTFIAKADQLQYELDKILRSLRFRIGTRIVTLIRKPYLFFWWPVKGVYRISRRVASAVSKKIAAIIQRKYRNTAREAALKKLNTLVELSKHIPKSNGSEYYQKSRLKVAVVTDEFMFNYYKDAVDLIYVSPENYINVFGQQIDIFLFISAWFGLNNKEWSYLSDPASPQSRKLLEIMELAKARGIKTIFQTIEDPPNYNVFLPYAKASDYIFTSTQEMIEKYKNDTGNENVFLLRYGVNPLLHNPIGFKNDSREQTDMGVLFAGSWYAKYKERGYDMTELFDGVIQANKKLIIADRNYYLTNTKNYLFPHKYADYIIPPIGHEDLQQVHKLFDWTLNLNSIKNSRTMCAMRVYELQALGSLVVSNVTYSIFNHFPNIFMASKAEQLRDILNKYSKEQIYLLQILGIRTMMSDQTVYDRLNEIFQLCGIPFNFEAKKVLIAADEVTKVVEDSFNGQSYKHKTLCSLQELDKKLEQEYYDYIAFFKGDYTYAPDYLTDMVNAFKYTDVDFVTKGMPTKSEYDYTNVIHDKYKTIYSLAKHTAKEILSGQGSMHGFTLDAFGVNETKPKKVQLPVLPQPWSFYKNIDALVEKIPDSNGCSYYRKPDINLAIITDELAYNSYKDAVNLYYVSPKNYEEVLQKQISALLFITCWRGLQNEEWVNTWNKDSYTQLLLFKIFEKAKSLGIKIIFISKEDPPDFANFLAVAEKADVIFTSASEMVEKYKAKTGNQRVYPLDYGINPYKQNPIGMRMRKTIKDDYIRNAIFFSGSWYERFPERIRDTRAIFDGVMDAGKNLVIADRNFFRYGFEDFKFPLEYHQYIMPSIDHEKLQKVHKLFDWAINLNSVKDSPTMCAARTYELQALGNLLLSNYSLSVSRLFPNISIIQNKNDVEKVMRSLSEEDIYRLQIEGLRTIFSKHTIYNKLNFLFEKAGIPVQFQQREVTVVCDNMTEEIIGLFNNQTYPDKKIMTKAELEAAGYAGIDYLAYFGTGIRYGRYYLEDMINAFKYTACAFITKKGSKEYDYVDILDDPRYAVIDSKRISPDSYFSGDTIHENGFALDPFGINDVKDKEK